MAVCIKCGCEFDVSFVRKSIGERFGADVYNEYYPEGDVCDNCALEEISTDAATAVEIAELMGDTWDD